MEGVLRPAVALLADRNHPRAAAREPVRDQLLLDPPVLRGRRERAVADLFVHRAADHRLEPQRHAPAVRRRRWPRSASSAASSDAASLHFDPPSSLIAGEDLLARIYNAIRSSSSATGSNHLNTTLLVTFDEHGGTYDHVPPPAAVPPDGKGAPGQMGFTFNRSGVRIPTLAISAWIPERTVVNDEFRATSMLATMRERFNLGEPFSAREASARSFADIFTLTTPRAQEDWPEVVARPVPAMPEAIAPLDAPLGMLGKSLLLAVLAFAEGLGKAVPDIKREDTITGAQRDRHRPRGPRRDLPRYARRRSVRTGCHLLGRLYEPGASVALPVGHATDSGREPGDTPLTRAAGPRRGLTPRGTVPLHWRNVTVDGSESGALLRRLSSGTRRRGSSPDLLLGSLPPEGASPPLSFSEAPSSGRRGGSCRPRDGRDDSRPPGRGGGREREV